jgi:hypothetical protein
VPTDVAIVKTTMKGLRRSLGSAQAKRRPTASIAKRMADAMPGDTLKGRCDRAMVMLGLAGAFRKSEVVALNVEDLEFWDEGVHITIRRSKADQEGKGRTIAILRGAGPFCPINDVRGHHFGRAVPADAQGGKRVGQRNSGRPTTTSSSRPLRTLSSTPASTAATPCGRVGYRRQPRTALQCGR